MKKHLFCLLFFLFCSTSIFAQGDPWYLTSFVSDDGQAILFMNGLVYFENKNVLPEGVLYKYYPETIEDMTIWLSDLDTDYEVDSIRLNADKTIVFQKTLFRKDESREEELLSKVEKFVQKLKEENERIEQERAKKYQDFIVANKWVIGAWRSETGYPVMYIFTKNYTLYYALNTDFDDPSDGLTVYLPSVGEYYREDDPTKLIIGFSTQTYESEEQLVIDLKRKSISFLDGEPLKRVLP